MSNSSLQPDPDVAPTSAGKSTIINAIAGQDLLPSRNDAMTVLPRFQALFTVIVYQARRSLNQVTKLAIALVPKNC